MADNILEQSIAIDQSVPGTTNRVAAAFADSSGNPINSVPDADGNYNLGTAVIQNILTSSGNTTTANLASGASFTGTSEETFGVNGIQVYHFADQDCTIKLQQGIDGTNWDIEDSFECLASEACTRTFTSVAPYFRLVITNDGDSTTTAIRSAAGMTPIIDPLPRALTDDDRLKTESTLVGKENADRHVWVSPTNTIGVNGNVRLVGTNFDGTTKDTNFWTEAVTGSGAVTQSGEIELTTGATANSTASYTSVRRARFVVGSALQFFGLFKFVTAGTADNVRRCGAYDATDGLFFELDGTTFSIGARKASSDTLVSSGSFNGNMGPNFTPDPATYYKVGIEWTPGGAFYYIDGQLLHKTGGGHLTDKLTLPVKFENVNDNGSTTPITFDCLGAVIMREGELHTNPTSKYILTGTDVLKYGAGILRRIVVSDNIGGVIIYDNTAASGTVITDLDTAQGSNPLGGVEYDVPFNTGLTIAITGNVGVTVIYE